MPHTQEPELVVWRIEQAVEDAKVARRAGGARPMRSRLSQAGSSHMSSYSALPAQTIRQRSGSAAAAALPALLPAPPSAQLSRSSWRGGRYNRAVARRLGLIRGSAASLFYPALARAGSPARAAASSLQHASARTPLLHSTLALLSEVDAPLHAGLRNLASLPTHPYTMRVFAPPGAQLVMDNNVDSLRSMAVPYVGANPAVVASIRVPVVQAAAAAARSRDNASSRAAAREELEQFLAQVSERSCSTSPVAADNSRRGVVARDAVGGVVAAPPTSAQASPSTAAVAAASAVVVGDGIDPGYQGKDMPSPRRLAVRVAALAQRVVVGGRRRRSSNGGAAAGDRPRTPSPAPAAAGLPPRPPTPAPAPSYKAASQRVAGPSICARAANTATSHMPLASADVFISNPLFSAETEENQNERMPEWVPPAVAAAPIMVVRISPRASVASAAASTPRAAPPAAAMEQVAATPRRAASSRAAPAAAAPPATPTAASQLATPRAMVPESPLAISMRSSGASSGASSVAAEEDAFLDRGLTPRGQESDNDVLPFFANCCDDDDLEEAVDEDAVDETTQLPECVALSGEICVSAGTSAAPLPLMVFVPGPLASASTACAAAGAKADSLNPSATGPAAAAAAATETSSARVGTTAVASSTSPVLKLIPRVPKAYTSPGGGGGGSSSRGSTWATPSPARLPFGPVSSAAAAGGFADAVQDKLRRKAAAAKAAIASVGASSPLSAAAAVRPAAAAVRPVRTYGAAPKSAMMPRNVMGIHNPLAWEDVGTEVDQLSPLAMSANGGWHIRSRMW